MGNDKNIIDQVIEFAREEMEFFHNENVAYSVIVKDDRRQVLKVDSEQFANELRSIVYENLNVNLKSGGLKEVVGWCKSFAKTDSPCRAVFIRNGKRKNDVSIDLADRKGRAVRISKTGFKVLKKHNVPFYQPPGQKPLVAPRKGHGFKAFKKQFPNMSLTNCKLIMSWIVYVINNEGPFPLLVIQGEQGSAKTFLMEVIRDLIDPVKAPLISLPRSERDLVLVTQNNPLLAFDNVSVLPKGMADMFCRVATGAGFSTRKLYSNNEAMVFEYCRPIMANGITSFILTNDLADRTISVFLKSISENQRRPKKDIWDEYQDKKPIILGSIYGAVSTALKNIDTVELERLPRMADFAMFACAAAPALRWSQGDFMKAYEDNRKSISNEVFDADKVAGAVYEFICEKERWEGAVGDLLAELEFKFPELAKKKYWPVSPSAMGSRLRQILPALRAKGVHHEYKKTNSVRLHKLWVEDIDAE